MRSPNKEEIIHLNANKGKILHICDAVWTNAVDVMETCDMENENEFYRMAGEACGAPLLPIGKCRMVGKAEKVDGDTVLVSSPIVFGLMDQPTKLILFTEDVEEGDVIEGVFNCDILHNLKYAYWAVRHFKEEIAAKYESIGRTKYVRLMMNLDKLDELMFPFVKTRFERFYGHVETTMGALTVLSNIKLSNGQSIPGSSVVMVRDVPDTIPKPESRVRFKEDVYRILRDDDGVWLHDEAHRSFDWEVNDVPDKISMMFDK